MRWQRLVSFACAALALAGCTYERLGPVEGHFQDFHTQRRDIAELKSIFKKVKKGDSWIYENGKNPAIVEAKKWFIEDLGSLQVATR